MVSREPVNVVKKQKEDGICLVWDKVEELQIQMLMDMIYRGR